MSRELQPHSVKPLEFTVTGSAEGLFKQIFAVGRKTVEEEALDELYERSPKLTSEYRESKRIIVHQAVQSAESKALFTLQTILIEPTAMGQGEFMREGYDAEVKLQVNPEIIRENLKREKSVQKLIAALEHMGYKAKLKKIEDEQPYLYNIEIFFSNNSAVKQAFISFTGDEGHEVRIELRAKAGVGHFEASYHDEGSYRMRITELQDALEKLARLAEAASIALTESFATSLPVPQTIIIALPNS